MSQIIGTSKDDVFVGTGVGDQFVGGAGTDTLSLDLAASNYEFAIYNGSVSVSEIAQSGGVAGLNLISEI